MQVSALSLAPKAANDREQLHKAAQAFEAIFVRQMLAAAHQTKFDDGGLFSSQGMETFQSMQDERFAEIATKSGGLGFAHVIEAQLSKHLDAAAAPGASTSSARAGMGLSNQTSARPEPVEGPGASRAKDS